MKIAHEKLYTFFSSDCFFGIQTILKKSKVDSLWLNNIGWSGYAYYTKSKNSYRLLNLGYIQKKDAYKKIYRKMDFTYKKLYDYEISSDFVTF